jgi:hypothetical protein
MGDQLVGSAAALFFGQQRPVVFDSDLLFLAPLGWVEAGHMELARLDPDLRAQDGLFLDRQLAGLLVIGPVVSRVVRDVDDLFTKREVRPNVPRARIVLVKLRVALALRLRDLKARVLSLMCP